MKEGKPVHLKPIEKFYSQVINDFWRKLEDEAKRGNFPFDIIDTIREKLSQEIDHPLELLRLKYRKEKKKDQEQRQLKERLNQNLKNEEPSPDVAKSEAEPVKVANDADFGQGDDEYFQRELKNEKEVMVLEETIVKVEDIQDPKLQEYDDADDQQGIEKELIIANANERVEMYLIGQSVKKKYVAKTEKIMIDLEDVFVKYKDREEFYKKINCSFVKIKPEEVKPHVNSKQ